MSHLVGDERGPIATIGELLLGKYRVERVVGEGGMGMVLAVRHIEVGELFAMKILKPSALREWRGPERFAREARAVSRLKSEHVARVFDVGQLESGLPYMLLEHLDGCDVRTVLDREGSLSARETIDCARLALDAIREAHEEGLIHRDLKPENLFLAKRPDGDWTIKVLDFGISKDLRDQGGGSVTHTSNVMGSPFYMSPEQMRSAKHVDERTDLWAMGIIMFELLTGEVPFPGETVTQVCASVLERPLPSIATLAPSTPASLVAVIEKLLAHDIDDRYPNARSLSAALDAVSDEIGQAPRGVKLSQVRRLVGRSTTRSFAVTNDEAPSRGATTTLPTQPPPPVRRSRLSRKAWIIGVGVLGVGAFCVGWSRQTPEDDVRPFAAHIDTAMPVPTSAPRALSVVASAAPAPPKPPPLGNATAQVASAKPRKRHDLPIAPSTPQTAPPKRHEGIY